MLSVDLDTDFHRAMMQYNMDFVIKAENGWRDGRPQVAVHR